MGFIDYGLFGLLYLLTIFLAVGGLYAVLLALGLGKMFGCVERIALSMVGATLFQAWCFAIALRLAPGADPKFYVIAVSLVFLMFAAIARTAFLRDIADTHRTFRHDLKNTGRLLFSSLVALVFALIFAVIIYVLVILPPAANDPLEYLTVAKTIFKLRALYGVYPLIDPNLADGFYGPWTHPPGFPLVVAWPMFIQGEVSGAGIAKLVNVFHLFAFAFLVFAFGGQMRRFRGIVAAMLVIFTPLLIFETFDIHVDVLRISVWTAAFLIASRWFAQPTWNGAILVGIFAGFSAYSHSIGLLFIGIFAGLCFIFFVVGQRFNELPKAVIVVVSTILLVSIDLWTNVTTFGAILADSVPVWELPKLRIEEHLRYARGLVTPLDILLNGMLRPFVDWKIFGFSHAVLFIIFSCFAVAMLYRYRTKPLQLLRKVTTPTTISVSMWAIVGFFGILFASVAVGSEIIVKNARYQLTMVGLVIVCLVWYGDLILRLLSKANFFVPKHEVFEIVEEQQIEGKSRVRQLGSALGRFFPTTSSVAVFLVGLVVVSSLGVGLRLVYTQKQIRFARFNVIGTTLKFEERRKAGVSNYPQFRMIERINDRLEKGELPLTTKVLSFRASGTAYYGKFQTVSWADPRVLEMYKAATARTAYDVARSVGITHIYTPAYMMAEMMNSGVANLLIDPTFVRIDDSSDGFFLYELVKEPTKPTTVPIVSHNGKLREKFPIADFQESFPSVRRVREDRRVLMGLNAGESELELTAKPRLRAVFDPLDSAMFFASQFGSGYRLLSEFKSYAPNGEYVVEAKIKGDGYARLMLTVRGRNPILVWEGLLDGETQNIGRLIDIAHIWDTASNDANRRIGIWNIGLSLDLMPGSSLKVQEIRMERVLRTPSLQHRRIEDLSKAINAGVVSRFSDVPVSFFKNKVQISERKMRIDLLDGRLINHRLATLSPPADVMDDLFGPHSQVRLSKVVLDFGVTLKGATLAKLALEHTCVGQPTNEIGFTEDKHVTIGSEIGGAHNSSQGIDIDRIVINSSAADFTGRIILNCAPEFAAISIATERDEENIVWNDLSGTVEASKYFMNIRLLDTKGKIHFFPMEPREIEYEKFLNAPVSDVPSR